MADLVDLNQLPVRCRLVTSDADLSAARSYLGVEKLRDLRLALGWSAQRLAAECVRFGPPPLTRSTIAKIESGVRKSVTGYEVAVLAAALGIDTSGLLCAAPSGVLVIRGGPEVRLPVVTGSQDRQGVESVLVRVARLEVAIQEMSELLHEVLRRQPRS